MNKKQIALLIFAMVGISVMIGEYHKMEVAKRELQEKVDALQQAVAHSTIELLHDTIRDTIPVASQPVVVIDKTDYKKLEADRELLKDLNLKYSQIESEMRVLMANQGKATLQASEDSVSVLRYKDRWCEFEYLVKPRELEYKTYDSLITLVDHEYKHKFLWWRWGTKGYKVTHINFNPRSEIRYSRYIKVEH
jgi:cellobiose-specific phosphotransferase system component IIB